MKHYITYLLILLFLGFLGKTQENKALYKVALQAYSKGDFISSIQKLSILLAAEEDFTDGFLVRARAHRQLKQRDAALKDYKKVMELEPLLEDGYYGAAGVLLEMREFEEGLEVIDLLISYDESRQMHNAYNFKGNCFYRMKKFKKAMEQFDIALTIKPDFPSAFNNRGSARYNMQNIARPSTADMKLALKDFNQAIELNPEFGEAYRNRALIHSWLKEYDRAIKDLEIAERLNPADLYVYIYRGNNFRLTHNHEQAVTAYEKALSINAEVPEAYIRLGHCYKYLSNWSKATKSFDTAVKKDKSFQAEILYAKATMASLQKEKPVMLDWLKKAKNDKYFHNVRQYQAFLKDEDFDNYKRDQDFRKFVISLAKIKKSIPKEY